MTEDESSGKFDMSRKERFLWVVQTGCLVRAFKDNWDLSFPLRIMAAATAIPEEAIPEDIDEAAFSFLQWQFKYGSVDDTDPPDWLMPFVKGDAAETGYWKF
jgi:hypothetical protein